MKKFSCSTCEFCPEFEFFSPTSYEAIGVCEVFPTSPEIVEHDDDEGETYHTHEGKIITDCPMWELRESIQAVETAEKEDCTCDECSGRCDPHPLFEKEIGEILSQKIFPKKPSDEDAQKARERLQGFFTQHFGPGVHLRFLD